MSFGALELILVFGVITLIFGGRKFPELAIGMGEAVREFRKSIKVTKEETKAVEEEKREEVSLTHK